MISRGVPHPLCLYFTSGDTGSFVWGRGILFCFVLFLAVLFPCCFVSIVLVLVVFSIVSCSYMSCVLF